MIWMPSSTVFDVRYVRVRPPRSERPLRNIAHPESGTSSTCKSMGSSYIDELGLKKIPCLQVVYRSGSDSDTEEDAGGKAARPKPSRTKGKGGVVLHVGSFRDRRRLQAGRVGPRCRPRRGPRSYPARTKAVPNAKSRGGTVPRNVAAKRARRATMHTSIASRRAAAR